MELEHLFDGETWYEDDGLWVYGVVEAVGYASGAGTLPQTRATPGSTA